MLGYLQNLARELDTAALLNAAVRVAAVLLCLTVHETCHGLAALALGDPTARSMNRLSLNPLRHIDWLGLVMMFAAGFGWAKPVPVDPRYFRSPKWGMALTALAGPASNFVLAAASLALGAVLWRYAPEGSVPWAVAVVFFVRTVPVLSIGLGLFNLLPFPPLDGSKVAAALLPDRVYAVWMRYERLGMMILLAVVLLGVWDGRFLSAAVARVYSVMGTFLWNLINP